MRKEKEVNDQNYSEALDKVKEFRTLHQQSEERMRKMEAELISMKTSVFEAENVYKKEK